MRARSGDRHELNINRLSQHFSSIATLFVFRNVLNSHTLSFPHALHVQGLWQGATQDEVACGMVALRLG